MSRRLRLTSLVLAMVASLAACHAKPESTQRVNGQFEVETLFTKDGCTVYRFWDSGYRYFTNCSGTASWREACGKNCTRPVTVDGGKP